MLFLLSGTLSSRGQQSSPDNNLLLLNNQQWMIYYNRRLAKFETIEKHLLPIQELTNVLPEAWGRAFIKLDLRFGWNFSFLLKEATGQVMNHILCKGRGWSIGLNARSSQGLKQINWVKWIRQFFHSFILHSYPQARHSGWFWLLIQLKVQPYNTIDALSSRCGCGSLPSFKKRYPPQTFISIKHTCTEKTKKK